jgi:hypothetical protein
MLRPNPDRAERSRRFDFLRRARCRHHNPRGLRTRGNLDVGGFSNCEAVHSRSPGDGLLVALVNQTDQKQIVRHSHELTSDRPQRKPQPAIHAHCRLGTWLTGKRRPVQGSSPGDRKDYPDLESPQESLRRSPPCQLRESACIRRSKSAIIFQRTEV